MARRTVKARNLRIDDVVLGYGKLVTMNQLWFNETLQERAWDCYMETPGVSQTNTIIYDNDTVMIDR